MTLTGRNASQPNIQVLRPRTAEGKRIIEAFRAPPELSTATRLDVLRMYFGGHEELQNAIYEWRLSRALESGTWTPKIMAVHDMYNSLAASAQHNQEKSNG